jgi:hypothetical protein
LPRYAYGGKSTVEGCRSIDVLQWNKLGYLQSSSKFPWVWTRDGATTASIGVEGGKDSLTLNYHFQANGREWEKVEQRIRIAWRPCRFGGERPWFICSNGRNCGRRVRSLYGAGKLFACRYCYGLAYASQQLSARYRDSARAQSIKQRVDGSANMLEEFLEKPKGMHWRTFARLRGQYTVAQARSLMGIRVLKRHLSALRLM